MYAGHVALGLALRRAPAAPPLWALVLAAQGPDWGDTLWELTGWRARVDPAWGPHGLPLVLAAAVAAGLATAGWRRSARAGALVALAWLAHWPMDWLTGLKPTWPGHAMAGRLLYGRPGLDLALEGACVVVGWWLWRDSLPADARRRAPAAALLVALLALQGLIDGALAGLLPRI